MIDDFVDKYGFQFFLLALTIGLFLSIYRADSLATRRLDILEKHGCATVVVESNR